MKIAAAILLLALPSSARAQDDVPPPPEDRPHPYHASELHEAIRERAEFETLMRWMTGVPLAAAGALGAGFGVYAWSGDLDRSPDGALALGTYTFAMGALFLGVGIYYLAEASVWERRLARLNRAPYTDDERLRFEGELRASAEHGAASRRLYMAIGIAMALAGLPILVLSAALDGLSDDGRIIGYVIGGLTIGLGGVTIAIGAMPSLDELAWDHYRYETGVEARGPRVRPIGGAIGLRGAF